MPQRTLAIIVSSFCHVESELDVAQHAAYQSLAGRRASSVRPEEWSAYQEERQCDAISDWKSFTLKA